MLYKLHRVAPNSECWARPSVGRLGQSGVGEYVAEHGFGHEDWNFNFDLATNGRMLGYTVARPAKSAAGEKFGLVLATYDAGGWRAAGYYDGATFINEVGLHVPNPAVEQMAADVFQLAEAGQTVSRYRDMTLAHIEEVIRTDFVYFCWSVSIDRVHVFRQPLPIPKSIFNPGAQRMVTSFDLSEDQFLRIAKLGNDIAPSQRESERETEEGARALKVHKVIERDPRIVAEFKANLTSFACSVCGFDFGERYGNLGAGFIECHHTKPVAKMKPGDKTKLSDLCAVCSNCHRMIHRSMPMLKCEQLRELIEININWDGRL